MKNILVTGGAGFIGSHTVVELIASGFRPIVIDNFANSRSKTIDNLEQLCDQKITFYKGDFGDKDLIRKIINDEAIDGVIHFAAHKSVGDSIKRPLSYYENNVGGLIDLLSVLEECGVKSFVFSSSATVYGEALSLPITEEEPIKQATSPYGSTKQIGETIIKDSVFVSKHLRALYLRYFNPIGAHPSSLIGELPIGVPANLIPFLTQTAAGLHDEPIVYGDDYATPDGTCIRDYIHVVDLAKAHVKSILHLLQQQAQYYETCNIGTGKGISILETINTFERVTGTKVPYRIGPRRAGDIVSAYAAVEKADKILNWRSTTSLEQALSDAWKWQKTLIANNSVS